MLQADGDPQVKKSSGPPPWWGGSGTQGWGYLGSTVIVLAATLVCQAVRLYLVPTNLMMIYLFGVIVAATHIGRRASILTAFLSVLAFDFFFIPPRFTLVVEDTEYIVTFIAFFTAGAVISTLVAQAREREEALRQREAETATLYHLSRDLAAASDLPGVLEAVVSNAKASLGARVALLVPQDGRLELKGSTPGLEMGVDTAAAEESLRHDLAAATNQPPCGLLYLPLKSKGQQYGALGVELPCAGSGSAVSRRLLEAFAAQATMALERVHLTMQAEQAQILAARENLARALLNSVSHDLRTPLVSISGALGTLRERGALLEEPARGDLVDTAWEQAERLNRFVGNLLDMTRLEAGAMRLKEEECDVQDLVGCVLSALEERLADRRVVTDLPEGLPPARMDMVLMTQVLTNLMENALKYAPEQEDVELRARAEGGVLRLEVADRGPGVPEQELGKIFDKFHRIPVPEGKSGTGLGLSICKGIVEVHGGTIRAENREGGGLRIIISLPLN